MIINGVKVDFTNKEWIKQTCDTCWTWYDSGYTVESGERVQLCYQCICVAKRLPGDPNRTAKQLLDEIAEQI